MRFEIEICKPTNIVKKKDLKRSVEKTSLTSDFFGFHMQKNYMYNFGKIYFDYNVIKWTQCIIFIK